MGVHLRAVVESDVPVFFAQQLDEEAARMAAFGPREDAALFTSHWVAILADRECVARTILVDGAVAGNLVCFPQDGRRLVGYWLGREHWGKGIATAALRAFLDVVPARPLHALVAVGNPASVRVLEKAGFRHESGPTVASDGVEESRYRLD